MYFLLHSSRHVNHTVITDVFLKMFYTYDDYGLIYNEISASVLKKMKIDIYTYHDMVTPTQEITLLEVVKFHLEDFSKYKA